MNLVRAGENRWTLSSVPNPIAGRGWEAEGDGAADRWRVEPHSAAIGKFCKRSRRPTNFFWGPSWTMVGQIKVSVDPVSETLCPFPSLRNSPIPRYTAWDLAINPRHVGTMPNVTNTSLFTVLWDAYSLREYRRLGGGITQPTNKTFHAISTSFAKLPGMGILWVRQKSIRQPSSYRFCSREQDWGEGSKGSCKWHLNYVDSFVLKIPVRWRESSKTCSYWVALYSFAVPRKSPCSPERVE